MKTVCFILLLLGSIGAAGYFGSPWITERFFQPPSLVVRTATVSRGPIVSVVSATGTVRPVVSVQVGSPVSGPILDVYADFNSVVKKGELLAKIDAQVYQANVDRDQAILATRIAEVQRAEAQLEQTLHDEQRAKNLREKNPAFISDTELDALHFSRLQQEAQVVVAKAAVQQAQGNLDSSHVNLTYTEIRAPVSGIVLDRRIQSGQTLASQFQVPELFIIAPDLEREIHVVASVGEADVGRIRSAQDRDLPVTFTVDAYPRDVKQGHIFQVRINSTTTQSIVTYPVVVSASNPDCKLLPGMTANLSFQVDSRDNVLRVPNAALRYLPDVKRIHPDERDRFAAGAATNLERDSKPQLEGEERQAWIVDGQFVRPVTLQIGLSDDEFTEVLEDTLREGQQLVVGDGELRR